MDEETDSGDELRAGGRYNFLLAPLKDLEQNWNIDIYTTLNEYIKKLHGEDDDDVDKENEQPQQRGKVFNFAEAAVLIFGSAGVYQKKVEYVHQLAMSFFEQLRLCEQKKKKKKGERRSTIVGWCKLKGFVSLQLVLTQ